MDINQIFSKISMIISREENYIPRDYKTIGGMWTVDTYKLGGVTLQIMDEGYTTVVRTNNLCASCNYANKIVFDKGTAEDLTNLLDALEKGICVC